MSERCPWHADVQALLVDGEIGSVRDPAAVARHSEDCAACRLAAARSRRLDALIAQSSAVQLSAADANRWLGALRAAPATPQLPPRRPARTRALAAAGIGLILTLLWLAPWQQREVPASAAPVARVASGPELSVELPDHPLPPLRGSGRKPTPVSLDAAVRILRRSVPPLASGEAADLSARALHALIQRHLAVQRLASARSHSALADLCGILSGPETAVADLVQVARRVPGFPPRVAQRLGSGAADEALVVAAHRLADPALDLALRRAAVEQERLRLAVGRGFAARGEAGPLLECWRELAIGGTLTDPERLLREWLHRAPARLAAEFAAELRTSRHGEQRLRAIHALAACPGESEVGNDALALLLAEPNRDEALAAAYALARRTPTSWLPRTGLAGSEWLHHARSYLRATGLAASRYEDFRTWLAASPRPEPSIND